MQSLRDKLLKAGLVSEEQAKRAEEETKKPREARRPPPSSPPRQAQQPAGRGGSARAEPQNRGGPPPRPSRPAQPGSGTGGGEFRIPKLPPLPGSREHQRLLSRKQLELDKKLLECVMFGEVEQEPGETVFYFLTRKQRLRRLELSAAQAKRLESGELAVVERPEPARIEHSLVTADVAARMFELSQKAVRFFNRPDAPIGFMSDVELVAHQEQEARRGPESDEESQRENDDPNDTGADAAAEPAAKPDSESEPSAQG